MPREITAFSNPLVKYARELRDKKHRRGARQFMAEGLRILTEARETGRLPRILFYAAANADHPLVHALSIDVEMAGGESIQTTPDILSKLSGKDNPQAVVGVFDEFDRTLADLDRNSAGIWLVAERLRDPAISAPSCAPPMRLGRRADPDRRMCRSLLGRGRSREHGGAVHRAGGAERLEEFPCWLRQGPGQLVGLSLDTTHDYRGANYAAPTFLLTAMRRRGCRRTMPRRVGTCWSRSHAGQGGQPKTRRSATAVMAYEVLAQQSR